MTFVDVPHRRQHPELRKRPRAGHAEHHLLLESRRAVAAVQTVRDVAVVGIVHRDVGVEQHELHVADARQPHLDGDGAAPHLDRDVQLFAVCPQRRFDRQVVEVGVVIGGALVALAVDLLGEVALPVQQSDTDERQRSVGRGLAVVACEDAESPGVDRQALGKPNSAQKYAITAPSRSHAPSPRFGGRARYASYVDITRPY